MRRCVRSGCQNPVGMTGNEAVCGTCLAREAAVAAKEDFEIHAYAECGMTSLDEFMKRHAAFDDWLAAHKDSG